MNHKRTHRCKSHKDNRGPTYGGAAEKPSVRRELQDDVDQEVADYEPDPCANGTCDYCFPEPVE